jgi:hypothetical protein
MARWKELMPSVFVNKMQSPTNPRSDETQQVSNPNELFQEDD